MNNLIEQRTNVNFSTKLNKKSQEIHEMLTAVYGETTIQPTTIRKWVKRFRDGREDVDDDARIGPPVTARIVHYEFVPEGTTVTAKYYLEVLKRLRWRIRQVRPELYKENRWILHQDNAPSHTTMVKRVMRGNHYGDLDAVKQSVTDEIKVLPCEDWKICFQKWRERWHKCILSNGEYFEGDEICIP
ncbi:hypothetical protein V9T40_008731 [Parthenolecanium corni]|uniref:Mos1 transposase HTH domain-containing protein n=1 Tax=Parthenolecanium corni TaxID=536013 RepID=A0AAN9TLF7_9HEMI